MAVTVRTYDHLTLRLTDGSISLSSNALKVALMGSAHAFTATHTGWSQVSANQIPAGNGYTAGGLALASKTWTANGSVTTFDAADTVWTATGGDIGPASGAVIYDDTSAGKLLVASIDFGGAQTAGAGTDFKITWAATGILTVTANT